MKTDAQCSKATVMGRPVRVAVAVIILLAGFEVQAVTGYDSADLAGSWQLEGLISGDSPDWHPGWYWTSLQFDAQGDASPTDTVHDSLGNSDYVPTLDGYMMDGAGTITIAGLDSYHGVLNVDKDIIVAVATMAPGDWNDVRGYNLQVLLKGGPTFATSDLAGTWQAHALVSGDSPEWVGWYRIGLTVDPNWDFTTVPGSAMDSDGDTSPTPTGTLSITDQGIVTFAHLPSSHGVMSADKSLIAITANDGGDGYGLSILQKRSGVTFTSQDLAGAWSLHGLVSGDAPDWVGWYRLVLAVGADGSFTLLPGSYTNSSGDTTQAVEGTFGISSDGTVTMSGKPSAHGTMSDDKSMIVMTMERGSGL